MLTPAEEPDCPPEDKQGKSNSRERSLTEKGLEMQEQEAKKNEKAFKKAYDSWKQLARETRVKLKALCSPEDLDTIERDIKAKHVIVQQHYEPIRRNHTTTPVIVQRMDARGTLTD